MKNKTEDEIKRELAKISNLINPEDLHFMSKNYKLNAILQYVKNRAFELAEKNKGNLKNDKGEKKVFYVSMEVLLGRTFSNNIMNLPKRDALCRIMKELGITVNEVEELEREPSLGNGGLGRLSACILESAATLGYDFTLVTLRYRTGLFRQGIWDGRQTEQEDIWTDEKGQYFFEERKEEESQVVHFRDADVTMIPCDIPQTGRGGAVNMLRTLMVGNVDAPGWVDTQFYKNMDDKLYPKDHDDYGKRLRFSQEYALSASVVGMAIAECKAKKKSVEALPEVCFIHINDTHASLMIPELMRVLMDEHQLGWDDAWNVAKNVFGYTNHTILAEALEKWPVDMVKALLPRVYEVIEEIDRRFKLEVEAWRADADASDEECRSMSIIRDGMVHMAHMDIYAATRVNGVAELHTEILCERELAPFYKMMPDKFCNITNGVTQRKFMEMADPKLAALITKCLGSDEWLTDMSKLDEFLPFAEDVDVQKAFMDLKFENKVRLSEFVKKQRGIDIPPHFIFDIQIKRFHEYKRQQMKCLHIISLYQDLKANPKKEMHPVAFIFGGKAASGYRQAKLVIECITALERLINYDPKVNQKMRVCFVEDYNVSKAEILFPAADLSEQISTASKEASGTGNMKFMMNGALTIGTLDGANVEICKAVGEENMFLFGLTSDEVMKYEKEPWLYNPMEVYQNEKIQSAVDSLRDGFIRREHAPWGESDRFEELVNEWLYGKDGNPADRYFVLEDFLSYDAAFWRMNSAYQDTSEWAKMALINIACSGKFSSDRMVKEYDEKIWHLTENK